MSTESSIWINYSFYIETYMLFIKCDTERMSKYNLQIKKTLIKSAFHILAHTFILDYKDDHENQYHMLL